MSTLTSQRAKVAALLRQALPEVPVWSHPPNNVAAPCAFIALGAATSQPIARRWEVELLITLVGPGGDNEAAVAEMESMILDAAYTVSDGMTSPVTWTRPGQTAIGGATYLAAELTVPIDIEPERGAQPKQQRR